METKDVIIVMSALAQTTRLACFQRLVEAGEEGMRAGDLTLAAKTFPNTMSAHLTILRAAGLVTQSRAGRSVIYRAVPERAAALTRYLSGIVA